MKTCSPPKLCNNQFYIFGSRISSHACFVYHTETFCDEQLAAYICRISYPSSSEVGNVGYTTLLSNFMHILGRQCCSFATLRTKTISYNLSRHIHLKSLSSINVPNYCMYTLYCSANVLNRRGCMRAAPCRSFLDSEFFARM